MEEQQWLEEGWIFHNHAWHLLHEIIKQIPLNTTSLLDIGAGTGIAAAIIKAVYPSIDIKVCDISENSKDFWRMRNIFGRVGKLEEIKFIEDRFDFVMSSHVIEHIEYNDVMEFVKEAYRISKNRLVLVVPDGDCHFYDHKFVYDRASFLDLIRNSVDYEAKITAFPIYHHHINNLMAVIDKV